MAHRPGGDKRVPRRPAGGRRWRPALARHRWLGVGLGAATVACAAAVAVGLSQAATAPACAAVQVSGTTHAPAGSRQGQVSGEATHYVLQGTGNCSYPGAPASQLFVALSPGEYDSAAACGSYVQVTGPDGSVTAEVIDQCPPCQAGHVDLSEAAFARIAPLSAGLVPVTYHTIADPALPAPLSMLVKDGSSAYWLALLPIGAGNAVTSVRVSSATHSAQELSRASYGYWLAPAGMGPGPFTVQLTDSAGHQATVAGVTLSPGVVQPTRTWMYGTAAPPPAAAPPASARPTPAATAHRSAPAMPTARPATAAPATVPATAAAAAPAPARSRC
jgi:expansin (peptidoglycan-binding protein)